ncbi:hypothetical protein [Paenibacillus sp. FSL R7-0272]|uniref:hypothetical protein n=1 Tax=Paenibacillus sp. FSL R7-0272 TaxID=2921679 RepID=UPI0030ED555A
MEWFDKNIKNHEVILERLHKSNLLFPLELAAQITIVASASSTQFMGLEELFVSSEKKHIADKIYNDCSRILNYKDSISSGLEKIISLEQL